MKFCAENLNRFFRYCIALTKDETDTADLLQESVERYLAKTARGIDKILNEHRYFLKLIRNRFIDGLRTQSFEQEPLEAGENVVPIDWRSMEEVLIDREETAHLLSIISPIDREILYLWAVEEFTLAEIAEQIERPLGTVLSRLHRVRLKLKEFSAEDGEDEEASEA